MALEQVPPPAATDPSPHDCFAADELIGRIRLLLAALPGRQAEVFWLSCVEGLLHEQIAAQLRTTPGAVRMLLSRARSALAESLNGSTFPLGSER